MSSKALPGVERSVAPAGPPQGAAPAPRWRWAALLGRHRVFLLALVLGAVLRTAVALAYQPALWFHGDSFSYLQSGVALGPDPVRPLGYAVLLRALEPFPRSLTLVIAVQHLAGLGVAALVYALLVRRSVTPWLATAATLPVLLDPYQLQLEHLVMSDALYLLLTTAGVVVLSWSDRPSWPAAAGAGLLLGAAAATRSVGLPVAVLLLAVLALRRAGLVRTLSAAVACALPLAAHLVWFHAVHDRWAFTHSSGIFLYSRTMAFADCTVLPLTAEQRQLCDPLPPGARPESSRYIWDAQSPLVRLPGRTFLPEHDRLAQGFALTAVRDQPGDYARVVARELGHAFAPGRPPVPVVDLPKYEFVPDPAELVPAHARPRGLRAVQAYDDTVVSLSTTQRPALAAWLARYQDVVRLPGPALAGLVVLSLAALLRRPPHRGAALTLLAGAAALLVLPVLTAQYDPRYVLVAVPLFCAAAALGGDGLRRRTAEPVPVPDAGEPEPQGGGAGVPRSAAEPPRAAQP